MLSEVQRQYKFDTGNDAILEMDAHITDRNNVKITKWHKPIRNIVRYGQLKIAHPDYVKWLEEKIETLQNK